MTLIKAAVCHGSKTDLIIEEIRLSAPEQDEIRVSVEACAICHSDITYIDGGWSIENRWITLCSDWLYYHLVF